MTDVLHLDVRTSRVSSSIGAQIAARFFAVYGEVHNAPAPLTEANLAELLAIAAEAGRQATLHHAFCLKGRAS